MKCRDSHGNFSVSVYNILTCSLCYTYLFPNSDFKSVDHMTVQPGLIAHNGVAYQPNVNETQTLEPMCSNLGDGDCDRWKDCCYAAIKCCEKQATHRRTNDSRKSSCPSTWDGWACFDDAKNGTTVKTSCPLFIKYGSLEGMFLQTSILQRHEIKTSGFVFDNIDRYLHTWVYSALFCFRNECLFSDMSRLMTKPTK